ncbi:hypothetical protein BLOT_015071 [Blomia tropicalis]|nr:hypothetical protein BLOT_015071 [Blomia tropicalis]
MSPWQKEKTLSSVGTHRSKMFCDNHIQPHPPIVPKLENYGWNIPTSVELFSLSFSSYTRCGIWT